MDYEKKKLELRTGESWEDVTIESLKLELDSLEKNHEALHEKMTELARKGTPLLFFLLHKEGHCLDSDKGEYRELRTESKRVYNKKLEVEKLLKEEEKRQRLIEAQKPRTEPILGGFDPI